MVGGKGAAEFSNFPGAGGNTVTLRVGNFITRVIASAFKPGVLNRE